MDKILSEIKSSPFYWMAFGVCTFLVGWCIFVPAYLPMRDLPQHASQVFVLKNLFNPQYGYFEIFEICYFTPYVTGILLATLLSFVFGVHLALKLLIFVAIVSFPLSLYITLKNFQGDVWWSLVGFGLGFGLNFFLGHVNFIVALPIGIIFYNVVLQSNYNRENRFWPIVIWGIILFFSHGIVFSFFLLLVIIHTILVTRKKALFFQKMGAFGLLSLLPLLYMFSSISGNSIGFDMPTKWQVDMSRLYIIPDLAFGRLEIPNAKTFGLLVVFFLILGSDRVKSYRELIIFAVALLVYLLTPFRVFAVVAYVSERMALFVIIFFMLALDPTRNKIRQIISRSGIILVVIVQLITLSPALQMYSLQATEIEEVIDRIPENKKVMGLSYFEGTHVFPGSPFRNHYVWYQIKKGGEAIFSFAQTPPQLVRYRKGKEPISRKNLKYMRRSRSLPSALLPRRAKMSDYVIVRSEVNKTKSLMGTRKPAGELMFSNGLWWLYKINR